MDYVEYQFQVHPLEEYRDILIAYLEPLDFETFVENETGFLAYAKENLDESQLKNLLNNSIFDNAKIEYTKNKIENKNWNEEWEKDFEPIIVNDEIYIKADFHPEKDYPTVIHIQPKLSFGTGHHETTYLMLQNMIEMDFKDKKVLDMGSGTAILAIYAKMRGAKLVEAIDIDEWAYENALENAERNQVSIDVKQGDASSLGSYTYDIIVANINKNILLEDIPIYAECLEPKGKLLLSGILDTDFADINAVCQSSGLIFEHQKQKNEWISPLYTKT